MPRLVFALALALAVHGWSQEVVTALRHHSASGTNIQFQGQFTANNSSGVTSLTQAWTCASTSDRLIIIGEVQVSSATGLSLSDTGGQAPGATVVLPFTSVNAGGQGAKAWNMGCASGSNSITVTGVGSGSTSYVIQILEYSGIGTSGSGTTTDYSTSTPATVFNISGTAPSSGMLAIASFGLAFNESHYSAISSRWNYRNNFTASGGNAGQNTSYPNFDNISVPTGTVNFTMTTGSSHFGNFGVILFIPGITATSPNWTPYRIQSVAACPNGNPTATLPNSVTAGNLITVAVGNFASNVPTSVTGTRGDTYTLQVSASTSGPNFIYLYTGSPTSSGSDTITANGSGYSDSCLEATEINGPGQTVSDIATQTTSSGTMTWTQTVSVANSIVYAACQGWHSSTTFNMTGFTFTATSEANGNDAIGGSWARTVSTNSVSPVFTVSTTDHNVCASEVVH